MSRVRQKMESDVCVAQAIGWLKNSSRPDDPEFQLHLVLVGHSCRGYSLNA
jgi:hypothetical protein